MSKVMPFEGTSTKLKSQGASMQSVCFEYIIEASQGACLRLAKFFLHFSLADPVVIRQFDEPAQNRNKGSKVIRNLPNLFFIMLS